MFRAKFRVLSITEERDHRVRFCMKPVLPKAPCIEAWATEALSTENARYWDATPAGEAEIVALPAEAAAMRERFPVGQAVFIDFQPVVGEAPADAWGLTWMQVYPTQLTIRLYPLGTGTDGKLEMGVLLKPTCLHLLDAIVPSLRACYGSEDRGTPQPWAVTFTPTAG